VGKEGWVGMTVDEIVEKAKLGSRELDFKAKQ